MAAPSISVVIPVYNSEKSLPPLMERLQTVLAARKAPFEVLFVNDGSRDRSWTVLEELSGRFPAVRGINLMRNFGQHNALLCGIRQARHAVIVTMDDDLQHPPEEIPKLLDRLDEGHDVVYGTPEHEQHGLWRDLASRVTKLALQSAMGAETARKVSAFRAFRAHVREAFAGYRSPFVSIDVLLTWGTTRFASLPVRHEPRTIGTSHYTLRKLMTHALNMMTGFSTVPLQLASLSGFAFTLLGLFVLVFVIGRYFIQGCDVPGFPFLASIIALFSGVQLFALGIIGEYLARMHFRTLERPTYAVRESTTAPATTPAAIEPAKEPCQFLDWDSAFFGCRIARVTAGRLRSADLLQALAWCSAKRIDCLYFLASADDPLTTQLVEAHGFRFVDTRVTLECALDAQDLPDIDKLVRPWTPADLPALRKMAATSHQDSRFYFDDGFARERCAELYATWIEKSCRGQKEHVFVAGPSAEPLGYISCGLSANGAGQIGLLGVSAAAQGQGVGRQLVQAALRWLADQGCRRATVVTQGRNCKAQRLYQRCGFVTRSQELWYHRWFTSMEAKRAA